MMADPKDWEVVDVPAVVELSRARRKQSPNVMETNESEEDKDERKHGNDQLCGFLWKLGAKGLIKTWKYRWFVYDARRCMLYYYRQPQDSDPLGSIDVANSTFTFSAETQQRGLFEIRSKERVYYLQARDKITMMFWLQQLQSKRREFNKLKSDMSAENKEAASVLRPTSGLLANEPRKMNTIDRETYMDQVERPPSIGLESAHGCEAPGVASWNLSFTNIKTEFKNWRKSGMLQQAPTGEPVSDADDATQPNHSPRLLQKSKSSPTILRRTKEAGRLLNDKSDDLKANRMSSESHVQKLAAALRRKATVNPSISLPFHIDQNSTCQQCNETRPMLMVLKDAISAAETEITTRDEVIQSLHDQIRSMALSSNGDNNQARGDESIEEKEHYIMELTKMVRRITEENQSLRVKVEENSARVTETKQQLTVLREMITAKDNAIISLTNRIYQMENPDRAEEAAEENPEAVGESADNELVVTSDFEQLKEACKAYVIQNHFLNSEILEMNRLRKNDEASLKIKQLQAAQLEAELFKIKSRYLLLLKEFNTPLRAGDDEAHKTKEVIERLLEDAIDTEMEGAAGAVERSPSPLDPWRASDKYGFYDVVDKQDVESLENLADKLECRSDEAQYDSLEMSTGIKWENYLVAQGTKSLFKSEELKLLIRFGIPHEFRARVWLDLIHMYTRHEREVAGPGYYKSLLTEKRGLYTPAAKQIELDLLRTLPNNKFYASLDSEGTQKLRQVLLAYSWHNPAVGYCQGLNRLGAIALLYLKEEEAFWCLVTFVEHLMPRDYYSRTLIGAQIDQRVLRDFLEEKIPKLGAHLSSLGVDLSLISFNWFLTIFVDIFPIELTLRVWDTFMYEGNKVLFRYALAVFKVFEEDLIKINEPGLAFNFFRHVPKSRLVPSKVTHVAFQVMNPFSKKSVEAKRLFYKPLLQAQLDEFETLRNDYVNHHDSLKSTQSPIFSEEDDD